MDQLRGDGDALDLIGVEAQAGAQELGELGAEPLGALGQAEVARGIGQQRRAALALPSLEGQLPIEPTLDRLQKRCRAREEQLRGRLER